MLRFATAREGFYDPDVYLSPAYPSPNLAMEYVGVRREAVSFQLREEARVVMAALASLRRSRREQEEAED